METAVQYYVTSRERDGKVKYIGFCPILKFTVTANTEEELKVKIMRKGQEIVNKSKKQRLRVKTYNYSKYMILNTD